MVQQKVGGQTKQRNRNQCNRIQDTAHRSSRQRGVQRFNRAQKDRFNRGVEVCHPNATECGALRREFVARVDHFRVRAPIKVVPRESEVPVQEMVHTKNRSIGKKEQGVGIK